jgi:hypothetical protein
MYLIVSPEGHVSEHDGTPTLDDLTRVVQGDVETRYLRLSGRPVATVWCDEDGKSKRLPVNRRLTRIAHDSNAIRPHDYICGTVVVTGGADDDGEVLGLDPAWVAHLRDR